MGLSEKVKATELYAKFPECVKAACNAWSPRATAEDIVDLLRPAIYGNEGFDNTIETGLRNRCPPQIYDAAYDNALIIAWDEITSGDFDAFLERMSELLVTQGILPVTSRRPSTAA